MHKFQFRLARVQHIRGLQAQQEEQKLEELIAGRRELEKAFETARDGLTRAQNELLKAPAVRPADLLAIGHYRTSVERECTRIREKIAGQEELVNRQRGVVVNARRNLKLLEKLEERQRTSWQTACDSEMEGLAADIAASRWNRRDE